VAIVQVQRRWPGSEHVQVCALISSLGLIACAPLWPDFEHAHVRAGGRAGVRACVHFFPAPFCEASSAGLLSCRTLSLHRCCTVATCCFLLHRRTVVSVVLRHDVLLSFASSRSRQFTLLTGRAPFPPCTFVRSDDDRVRALRKHERESVLKEGANFGMGIDRNPAGTSRNL